MLEQANWRRCIKCQVAYYDAAAYPGRCAAGGLHNAYGSAWYRMAQEAPAGVTSEDSWCWCRKCQSLHYASPGAGPCADGGSHDTADSPRFFVASAAYAVGGEIGWRRCARCQSLFNPNNTGVCPLGGAHDGTGSSPYSLKLGPVPALDGAGERALEFDGVDDHVALPAVDLDVTHGVTIEAWVAFEALTSWARIIDLGNGPAAHNIVLHCSGNPTSLGLTVYYAGGGYRDLVAVDCLGDGQWMHLAATIDANGKARLYKNGVELVSGDVPLPDRVARVHNYIGRSNWAGNALFKGRMSDVRLWTRARTIEDIRTDRMHRLTGGEDGLAGYWRLDDADGVPVLADASRNGLEGAAIGGPTRPPTTLGPLGPARPERDVLALAGDGGHVALSQLDLDGSKGFAVEAWVLCSVGVAGTSRLIDLGNGDNSDNIVLACENNIDLFFHVYVGGAAKTIAVRSLDPGRWHHIVATVDASGFGRIFRDGVQMQSGPMQLPSRVVRTKCFLGKSNRPADVGFSGRICDVRLWSCPRTEGQIRADMGHRLVGDEANLHAYWRLDEGAGTAATDARIVTAAAPVRKHGVVSVQATWRRAKPPLSDWCVGLASAVHEGKVVIAATSRDGRILYTVKQSGFEDSALAATTRLEGWEDWRPLALPNEAYDDASVVAKETAELTYQADPGRFIVRSRYRTSTDTAAAPVQLVAGMGHVYVVRQSKIGTLLVDRFVLDGMTNVLVPKLEVRFKRSKQRHATASTIGDSDTYDFTDTAGNPFYEPSTELGAIDQVQGGRFAVVLLPTADPDRQRWHFFVAVPDTNKIEMIAIRSAEGGLFDVADHRSLVSEATLPGIRRTTITLPGAVDGGPAATRYDIQEERQTESGETQLMRTATRVMLAVPTTAGTATLSFGASLDGALVELPGARTGGALRADRRDLLLPLSSLDDVRPIGADATVHGDITAMARSEADQVRISSPGAAQLAPGDTVLITNTARYDGPYTVHNRTGDSFEITAPWAGGTLGRWERVKQQETGQIFDGIILGHEAAPNGKLRVMAFNHQLANDDTVQIVGTSSQDGTYQVSAAAAGTFEIARGWLPGEAVNVKLRVAQRRGLRLDATRQQYVSVAGVKVPGGGSSYTLEAWIKPDHMGEQCILGWGNHGVANQVNTLALTTTGVRNDWNGSSVSAVAALAGAWHHVAATYDAVTRTRRLYVDGVQVGTDVAALPHAAPAAPTNFAIGRDLGAGNYFSCCIADARVWDVARTADQIVVGMHQQLTGREVGLCGFWRLGGILEDAAPKVADLSPRGRDGVVHGGAYVSGKLLRRQPTGWSVPAVRFVNDDLVAVTQGGSYEESFEFRATHNGVAAVAGFEFACWGRRSRTAEETIGFPEAAVTQLEVVDLADGWRRAACRFTVPDGVALIRAFGIDSFTGTWDALEVRRHRVQAQTRVVTELRSSVTPSLPVLADTSRGQTADLQRLDGWLREEAVLLAERADLLARIDQARRRAEAEAAYNAAKARLTELEAQLKLLEQQRKALEVEKLQFWCRITACCSDKVLDVLEWGARGNTLGQYTSNGYGNQRFRCTPVAGEAGVYTITVQWSGLVLAVENGSMDDGAAIVQTSPVPGRRSQQFRFYAIEDDYVILAAESGRAFDIDHGSRDDGARLIQFRQHREINQRFRIDAMAESDVTNRVLVEIASTRTAIADVKLRIAALKQILDLTAEQIAAQIVAWEARVVAIDARLVALQPQISAANTALLQAAHAVPRGMTAIATDDRGLKATGAVLPWLRPFGQLSAAETCEGDVQLSCFDRGGDLRVVRYDATADAANVTFEQWLPDRLRSALSCRSEAHRVALADGVGGGGQWSAEAWFLAPLPPTARWNTLFASTGGECHVLVEHGRTLGSWLVGKGFVGCGHDVSSLRPGWHHLAVTAGGAGEASTTTFYIDGQRVGDTKSAAVAAQEAVIRGLADADARRLAEDRLKTLKSEAYRSTAPIACIGNNFGTQQPFGMIAEVRVWGCTLSAVEVAGHARSVMSGREPFLLAYYTMVKDPQGRVSEVTGSGPPAFAHGVTEFACTARIGGCDGGAGTAALTAEYSTIGVHPGNGLRMALMRRCLACVGDEGVRLYADRRVEELDLRWIGNAQFAPTLLGYIEGAPPVPSENLTLQDSYAGATSVELTMSEDTTYGWARAKQTDRGSSVSMFFGTQFERDLDLGLFTLWTNAASPTTKLFQTKAGVRGNFTDSRGDTNETAVTAQSSNLLSDRLELRGTMETVARFPHLGRRFVPKNVGYALVVSSVADVYVTRLKRSGRMVGYQVQPDEKRPPDINTITFLINPAYTMNGSLDGQTGSAGTSDRFHRHVPAMRAQHGSRYPASYYRLDEAYALKRTIDRKDRERETYFQNFDARTLSWWRNANYGGEGAADDEMASRIGSPGATDAPAQATGGSTDQNRDKQAAIESRYADRSTAMQATSGLQEWQRKMDDLRLRAGKRNIVNTYVWDADGGLRSEVQQFATTIEHSIGSSLSSSYEAGFEGYAFVIGVGFELSALATLNYTETISKTAATGRGFALEVGLGGVESGGITNHNDVPLQPGEKVNRYRFMSYYLEGETQHYDDFFRQVVDPEWLAGNSESARALRQVQGGKPNKTWRVLHRVTYVERPALASFGQDTRPLVLMTPPPPTLEQQVADLTASQQALADRLERNQALLEQKLAELRALLLPST